jgi:hypothetical protein
MDCTNCGEKCPFVQTGFCKTDRECPNYIESWWTNEKEPQPKLIKDCFPKKFSLEQNQLTHRVYGLQASIVELRNRIYSLEHLIKQLIQQNNSLTAQIEIISPQKGDNLDKLLIGE